MTQTPTIRPASPADLPALTELFVRAADDSPVGNLWQHPASEMGIYLTPYVDHPQTTVLLAWVDGDPLGYLAGCYDSAVFPSEQDRITTAIRRHRLMLKAGPVRLFLRAGIDTLAAKLRRQPMAGDCADARWPAHLHIAVVPEARGHGVGPRLMQHWLMLLDRRGVAGCYLQTQVENLRARTFFVRFGFVPHGEAPPIGGIRWQGGRLHQLTMVRPPA